MNKIWIYILIIVLGLVQVAIAPIFSIAGASFNLLIIFAVIWLSFKGISNWEPVLFSGIVLDLISFERFGVWTVTCMGDVVLFFILGHFITNIETFTSQLILVLVGVVFVVFVSFGIQSLLVLIDTKNAMTMTRGVLGVLFIGIIYDIVILGILRIPLISVFNKIEEKKNRVYRVNTRF